ncbi:MAG: spermidine synthase [Cellvibrionaceae bacterium]|jgi:spermidine synthase
MASEKSDTQAAKHVNILIFSTFIAGVCSIVYELLIATTSSYFLGDSIKQFSLVIGFYMATMGLGSYLSRMIGDGKLLHYFISAEILLGLVGGLSVPLLYFSFAYFDYFQFTTLLLTSIVGLLIGLEIPLLSRLMSPYFVLKDNLSNVLSVDYLGALIATLLFPFLLLPFFGIFKTSLFFGLVNMSIGFSVLWFFSKSLNIEKKTVLYLYSFSALTILITIFLFSHKLLGLWTDQMYDDRVVYAKETPYQQIVLTKSKEDIRLFLNGNLQFSSADEYRYHESLVHIPMLNCECKDILLLGGGDGLAIRELMNYSDIQTMTLVDLDPEVTTLAKSNSYISSLNNEALDDERLTVINKDAFVYLSNTDRYFDLIIIDLPDPNNTALSRLYSREFYLLVKDRLSENGSFVTQGTSPFYAPKAFWSIKKTIVSAGYTDVVPYHTNIPSFGEWGFILASKSRIDLDATKLPVATKYVDAYAIERMLYFEKDMRASDVEISTLDSPKVLDYYLDGWKHWK